MTDEAHADAARGFGDVASRYAALRPDYPDEIFDFALSRLGPPRETAVDLGAGTGQASRALARRFSRVFAVEPDARMRAEISAARVEAVAAAAEEAEFPDATVDAVFAATSFHWMDQDAVCARAARWLRPGGVFFPFLYGPFIVHGPARAIHEAHWRRWAPFMDRRLGAKADYARAIQACAEFEAVETFSGRTARRYGPADAADLMRTASYARAYAASLGDADGYFAALAREFADAAPAIEVEFPLGGVIARRRG